MSDKNYIIIGGHHDGECISVSAPLPSLLRLPSKTKNLNFVSSKATHPTKLNETLHIYILRNLTFNIAAPVHHPSQPNFKTVVNLDYYLSAEVSEVHGINNLLEQALRQYESNR